MIVISWPGGWLCFSGLVSRHLSSFQPGTMVSNKNHGMKYWIIFCVREHLPHAVSVCSAAVLHYEVEDGWGLCWQRDTGHGPRWDCGSTEKTPTADTDKQTTFLRERGREGVLSTLGWWSTLMLKILKTSKPHFISVHVFITLIRYSWELLQL